ncbi:hypothetical protein [Deinococcus cellulosilyticus]|uniref:Uncharacterized protein n=1 Tax=Deinococcus cellulosilyticus (strain DSM 18568 / NBRC 106333 / KACC 11606 / 5516J-15) TaxID=1223518 RepID=A0A511NC76_DEIC1|nr:hypothetical protein [Deinococcus cellulosilyticus]GEM50176.1 hypothetical protein DC3_58110 [Deinococcus cellulosilyticus NBRC 106333 = KACC 11606]
MIELPSTIQMLKERWLEARMSVPADSELQICYLISEYELGVSLYQHLEHISPEDTRWVANCYSMLGQREKAREYLMKAMAQGNLGAAVDFAMVSVLMGFTAEAEKVLDDIKPMQLNQNDLALYYRCQGFLQMVQGDQHAALKLAQMAWKTLQSAAHFKIHAPRILLLLASIYKNIRQNDMCLYYARRAEEICSNDEVWNIKMLIAISLYEDGEFQEVRPYLQAIHDETTTEVFRLSSQMYLAYLDVLEGRLEDGKNKLLVIAETSEKKLLRSIEVPVRAYLVTLLVHMDERLKAVESLYRTEKLATTAMFQLIFQLHKIHMEAHLGDLEPQQAIQQVQHLMEEWHKSGDLLEYVRSRLYYCELLLMFNDARKGSEIELLVQDMVKQDCKFYGAEDVVILPHLKRHLTEHYGDLFDHLRKAPKHLLYLDTIDREQLRSGEDILPVPLRKTIEVITFLHHRKQCTLREVVLEVFGEVPPEKAKNYFHQIRHVLSSKNHLVTIEFDRTSRRYSLRTEFPLVWDLQACLDGQKKLEGIFLPSSGSDWVIELNQRLSE